MSKVQFNLKNATSNTKTAIMTTFCFKGQRIRLSSGMSITPKYWNNKTKTAREILEFNDGTYINERLNKISSKINSIYNQHLLDSTLPDNESLKQEIKESINHEDTIAISKSFWNYFEEFIEYKKTHLSDVKDYDNSLRKHIVNTEKIIGKKCTINGLRDQQNGFIDSFNHYLHHIAKGASGAKGMSLNTIGKQHKNIKVFLNWCFDKEICDRFSLKHIVTEQEEIESIYLTKEEIELIIKYKPKTDFERIVKDLFLIGCETGLRFSDFTALNSDHIINNQIHFKPKKTKGNLNNKVIIPMSQLVKSIVQYNNNDFPIYGKNTLVDFNSVIRDMAKELKINQKIQNHRKVNGKYTRTSHYKYELLSSHTCRRTFCTQKFLDGMPVEAIMKFSGHKTSRAFMRYLRLDSEVVALKYKSFF